jgi:protein farnesyltransferase subunit beta
VLFPCSPIAAFDAAAAGSSGNSGSSSSSDSEPNPLFNTRALQLWVLRGCQQLKGGLRDKPGKSADYYHTCYCLSGLSAAQHIMGGFVLGQQDSAAAAAVGSAGKGGQGSGGSSRKGVFAQLSGNRLAKADPLLNVVVDKLQAAKAFYEAAGPVL